MGKSRRTDNPLSILVMGVMSIAFFGGVVVYFNETRPILKLRPLLAQKYSAPEIRTRFVPPQGFAQESSIVVSVPARLADRKLRFDLAAFSLPEYRRLAKGKTRVTSCTVVVADDPDAPPVTVSDHLLASPAAASAKVSTFRAALKKLGLRQVTVTVHGVSFSGAEVRVRGRVRDAQLAKPLALKAANLIGRHANVGLCTVTVLGPKIEVAEVGGRDAPPRPAPPRPATPGGVAPIDSTTRRGR